MSSARVLVWVVLLALLGAGGVLWDVQQPPRPPQAAAPPPSSPAMDVASSQARQVLRRLMLEPDSHVYGHWLGDQCQVPGDGETYVLSRRSFRDRTLRRILVVLEDDRGRLNYDVQLDSREPKIQPGHAWPLDASGGVEMRRLVRKSGYFELGSSGFDAICDGDIISLESCIDGRYYGEIRQCEDFRQAPRSLLALADGLEALAARVSAGATMRQTETIRRQAEAARPPPGM